MSFSLIAAMRSFTGRAYTRRGLHHPPTIIKFRSCLDGGKCVFVDGFSHRILFSDGRVYESCIHCELPRVALDQSSECRYSAVAAQGVA